MKEITNKSDLLRKYKEAEKSARRQVKSGFPFTGRFTSPSEIADYLHGDVIVCLLCGRSLKGLAGHLSAVHGVSADEYRERYGLPYRTGLSCQPSREAAREAQISLGDDIRRDRAERMRDPEIIAKRRDAASKQRTSGYKRMQAIERVSSLPPPERTYHAEHASEVISLMERHGITLTQAIRQAGGMKFTTFRQILMADDKLITRYKAIAGIACWEQSFGNKWGHKGRPR